MNTLDQTASGIETAVASWRQRLLQLAAEVAHCQPAPDRWSISEVIGHLIDSACNNHQRFVRAQHCDALVFPKYEQNEWVAAANYRQGDWETLVQLWYFYNYQLATVIRNIPISKLSIRCTIGSYDPCTLGFLVEDYLTHLLHHLEKVSERLGVGDSLEGVG